MRHPIFALEQDEYKALKCWNLLCATDNSNMLTFDYPAHISHVVQEVIWKPRWPVGWQPMSPKIYCHIIAVWKRTRGRGTVTTQSPCQYKKNWPLNNANEPLGSKGMSLLKVFALSSQPCKQSTGRPCGDPHALAAIWPQGTKNFNSEIMPKTEKNSKL